MHPGVGGGAGIWWEFVGGGGCLIFLRGQRARDPAPLSFYYSGFTHQTHPPGAPAHRWRQAEGLTASVQGGPRRVTPVLRGAGMKATHQVCTLRAQTGEPEAGVGDRLRHPTEGQGRFSFRNGEPDSAQSHEEHLCPETGSP